jgi:hypothetical protein
MQLWQAIIAGPPTKRRLMVPLIIMSPHSERQLLLQGEGVGGHFFGQSEGLSAPFFWDGPPTSTSFLEGSSTERARRSALGVGLRVADSHQPQRSDASILLQRLSLQVTLVVMTHLHMQNCGFPVVSDEGKWFFPHRNPL